MSYKSDIAELRDKLKVLGYKEIPNILDLESQDLSSPFIDMGYTLLVYSIEDEDLVGGASIGSRLYRLQVTYKAQNSKEYDIMWEKFEALYRAIKDLSKNIESNIIEKYQDNQFQYLGNMEFSYGQQGCN